MPGAPQPTEAHLDYKQRLLASYPRKHPDLFDVKTWQTAVYFLPRSLDMMLPCILFKSLAFKLSRVGTPR